MSDADYARLLALRTGLRHFQAWSARQARAAGLTPTHHQLLLAIRGHDDPSGPTIGEVADYLLLRHHSAVGLVDRAEAAGLVRRTRSDDDHRVVHLHLTEEGAARLEALSALHLEELDRLAFDIPKAWEGLGPVQRPHGFAGEPLELEPGADEPTVDVARVDDVLEPGSTGVLVDRRWPRGVPREPSPFTEWSPDVAPSAQLQQWYRSAPARYEEFERRYRKELARSPAKEAVAALRAMAEDGHVVLMTATKVLDLSAAAVLRRVLSEH